MADCAVFDVDGTLVDSNYQHVVAWNRAFRGYGVTVPLWQIHRHMGMGGDKLVPTVAGEEVEEQHGEELREAWKKEFDAMIDEVAPMPGATELLQAVKAYGARLVLASSGKPDHVDHFLDLLEARDIADAWTSSGDVENTKPEPDLLAVAVEKLEGDRAVTFGDATWDCLAAGRLGLPAVMLRTGGFGVDELREAGAADVFETLDDMRADIPRLMGLAAPIRRDGS